LRRSVIRIIVTELVRRLDPDVGMLELFQHQARIKLPIAGGNLELIHRLRLLPNVTELKNCSILVFDPQREP
jgi:hypothetical protein